MPPWHADAPAGTFHNERRLSDADAKTLIEVGERRRAEGRSEGPAADADVRRRLERRQAGRRLRDAGGLQDAGRTARSQYEYFYIPTNFTEPKWVKSIEVRPGNREVVHHVLVLLPGEAGHARARRC